MAKYKCSTSGSTIGKHSKKFVSWKKDEEFIAMEGDVSHVAGMELIESKKRRSPKKKGESKSAKKTSKK